MTIREHLESLLTNYDLSPADKEFVRKEIDKHDRKSTNRKPTTAQLKAIQIANGVYEDMELGVNYTVTDMMKSLPTFAEVENLTQSYANAIVKRLKDSGMVERTEVKGRAYFSKIVTTAEVEE